MNACVWVSVCTATDVCVCVCTTMTANVSDTHAHTYTHTTPMHLHQNVKRGHKKVVHFWNESRSPRATCVCVRVCLHACARERDESASCYAMLKPLGSYYHILCPCATGSSLLVHVCVRECDTFLASDAKSSIWLLNFSSLLTFIFFSDYFCKALWNI